MMLPSIRRVVAPCLVFVLAYGVVAAPPAGPEPINGADYPTAFKYTAPSLRPFVYDTAVNAGWIGKTDVFWYGYRTSQGTRYYRVDPKRAVKDPLFDHEKLAALPGVQRLTSTIVMKRAVEDRPFPIVPGAAGR